MFSFLVGLGSGYPLKNYGWDPCKDDSVDTSGWNLDCGDDSPAGPSVDNLGGPSVDDGTSNPSLEEIYEKFTKPKPSIDGTSADDLFDPKSIEDNGNAPMTAVNAANVLSTKYDDINVPIGNSIAGLPPSYLKPITYTNTKPNTYEVLTSDTLFPGGYK